MDIALSKQALLYGALTAAVQPDGALSRASSVAANDLKNCYALEDSRDADSERRHQLRHGRSSTTKDSPMQRFFAGSNVLVTGATGFLGKVLIEKLLRSCPDLESVLAIVRSKNGKDERTRIAEMFDDVLFERLRRENPNFASKVVPVVGDFAVEGLGLSEGDRQMILDKVSIIIHGAATVRFDEALPLAAAINVRGTKDVLDLAKKCRRLRAVTHISSAFANCHQQTIDEIFYDSPMNYNSVMALSAVDPKVIEDITPRILGKFPNTYAFTKAIAEDTVRQYAAGLPACVVRPGIVISTYEEPIRGWTDNFYGPSGVVVGCGTGILRTMQLNVNCQAELVPVDWTVNCILAATCDTAVRFKENETSDIPIYNFVSSEEMPLSWGDFTRLTHKHGRGNPTMKAVWYYGFNPTTSRLLYLIYSFFLHYIPFLLADTALGLMGKEKVMLKMYRKLDKFNSCLAYFTTREWKFRSGQVRNLWRRLLDSDQTLFPFDMSKLSWDETMRTNIIGIRVYLLKDSMSTVPEATVRRQRLFYAHQILKAVFFSIITYITWTIAALVYKCILG